MNRKKFLCYLLLVDLHLHFVLANLILPEWLLLCLDFISSRVLSLGLIATTLPPGIIARLSISLAFGDSF